MSDGQLNNSKPYHCPVARDLDAHGDVMKEVVRSLDRLTDEIKGWRADNKDNQRIVQDAALQRSEKMMPIRSHYMVLIGTLILLLGAAVVKEAILGALH